MKSTAYSYQRFSSPEQAKGDSLRRQTELRDAWVKRHGVRLDLDLKFRDEGVSGWRGANRSDTAALGQFLRLVNEGRIAKGSYLIVESLDRLSREHVQEALRLLLNLTAAGVKVVQLLPVEMVYDAKSDTTPLLMAVMELSRGHSESAMKSERVGRAWENLKRNATPGKPITARCPSWLSVEVGRFRIRPQGAAAVRRIFALAVEGFGIGAITKRLNREKVPPIGRADFWARSYVAKILHNRAVFGEYQPHTRRGGERRPDGKPVPGFYPAVVNESAFYAAKAAMDGRKGKAGRPGTRQFINVWSGLLIDARDGSPIHAVDKGKRSDRILTSYFSTQGAKGAQTISFPFAAFEEAVLSELREIDPVELLPQIDRTADESLILAGRLSELDGKIDKVKGRIIEEDDTDALADVLKTLTAKRKKLCDQLEHARQVYAAPVADAWGEAHTLIDALGMARDQEAARVRLRAALRRITEDIRCVFAARGSVRLAAVQIRFSGGEHRDYLIVHMPARGNASAKRKPRTEARSFADTGPGPLDFRKPKDIEKLLRFLNQQDRNEIEKPRGSGKS